MKVYECILSLIAGVGVFILAMKLMSDSLNQIAGERMKRLLEKLAGNRIVGVLVGALVTAVIQSSSATTVMVIGFVNANVMDLNQAAAIIIGSNIGTTVTGLLASLESLNISLYLSLLVFIGVMLAFVRKIRKIANLMTGLGMIFVGLKMMSSACDDQSIRDAFSNVLKNLEFPLLLELLGIIFTAIIQSSSAMTGIVIVMVGKKAMTIRNGLFITLGANIGTCVTAMIGIIGANTNSKRTALIHLIFNVSGCIIFTPILWIFSDSIVNILSKMSNEDAQRIAFFHLFFNPEEFLEWFIKDKEDKDEGLLNPRPSSNSVNINIINEENAIIDTNQSESNDDTIIKEDKLIKDDNNKDQNLIIKDDIKKDENKILINNNEKENDKMIN